MLNTINAELAIINAKTIQMAEADCIAYTMKLHGWDRDTAVEFYNSHMTDMLTTVKGRKYTKIVRSSVDGKRGTSSFAFVDNETGAVYKAASWSAKGSLVGQIENLHNLVWHMGSLPCIGRR